MTLTAAPVILVAIFAPFAGLLELNLGNWAPNTPVYVNAAGHEAMNLTDWIFPNIMDGGSMEAPGCFPQWATPSRGWDTAPIESVFKTPEHWNGRRVWLGAGGPFVGTLQVNGVSIGGVTDLETPFQFDITDYLNPAGRANVAHIIIHDGVPNCSNGFGIGTVSLAVRPS